MATEATTIAKPSSAGVRTAHRHISRRQMIQTIFVYVLIFSGAVVLMVPFFWMLSTSLKTLPEVQTWPIVWIPSKFIWANYPAVFQRRRLPATCLTA